MTSPIKDLSSQLTEINGLIDAYERAGSDRSLLQSRIADLGQSLIIQAASSLRETGSIRGYTEPLMDLEQVKRAAAFLTHHQEQFSQLISPFNSLQQNLETLAPARVASAVDPLLDPTAAPGDLILFPAGNKTSETNPNEVEGNAAFLENRAPEESTLKIIARLLLSVKAGAQKGTSYLLQFIGMVTFIALIAIPSVIALALKKAIVEVSALSGRGMQEFGDAIGYDMERVGKLLGTIFASAILAIPLAVTLGVGTLLLEVQKLAIHAMTKDGAEVDEKAYRFLVDATGAGIRTSKELFVMMLYDVFLHD